MSANLLELQEMLRNLDMGSVRRVAAGEHGKAAQLLGMDEIRYRGEQMQEAKANQAEQQMQQPAMIDQYLAMSQQAMGQPVAPPPMMPAPAQQGIGSMMPQQPSPRMPAPQMAAAPPRPQMNPMAPAQPPQQMPPRMFSGGGTVRGFADGGLLRKYPWLRGYEGLGIPENVLSSLAIAEETSPGSAVSYLEGISKQRAMDSSSPNEGVATGTTDAGSSGPSALRGYFGAGMDALDWLYRNTPYSPGYTPPSTKEPEIEEVVKTPAIVETPATETKSEKRNQLLANVNQALSDAGPLPKVQEQPYLEVDKMYGVEEPGIFDRFGKTVKSGKLQPLFDMMMRSGLGLAAGENIGEAGIAGLTQATDLAQQRREDARKEAADELQARLGESRMGLEKSQVEFNRLRGEALGDTYLDAAKLAQKILAEDAEYSILSEEEKQKRFRETVALIQSRGLGGLGVNRTLLNPNYDFGGL